MRKFRIHWTVVRDGQRFEDSMVLQYENDAEAESCVRDAHDIVAWRGGIDPWSEEVT